MLHCACCNQRLVYHTGVCGCSAVYCRSCLLCDKQCTCPNSKSLADIRFDSGITKTVEDVSGHQTNYPYDTGPVADQPIIVGSKPN
jgi:hypothetical protein